MPVRSQRLIAAVMLLAMLAPSLRLAAAEAADWSCRAWQTEDGLPDDSVTGVEQTADGYLWVATYAGLTRFNGASFKVLPLPSLYKKSVRVMLLDHCGRFWLGMDPGSVICLESNASRVFPIASGLPAERITSMAEDREGAVWIMYSTTLCQIKNEQVTSFTGGEGLPAGINGWVAGDSGGELWYSKGGKIGVFRDGRLAQKLSLAETSIRICGSASPGLWICAGSVLFRYRENSEPEKVAQLPGRPGSIEPQVLFEDREGALWIGTAADGLFRFKGGGLEKVPTSHQSVNCVSEDREGNLWAGMRGGGLNLIRPSAVELVGR